jgi:hypothetical protein
MVGGRVTVDGGALLFKSPSSGPFIGGLKAKKRSTWFARFARSASGECRQLQVGDGPADLPAPVGFPWADQKMARKKASASGLFFRGRHREILTAGGALSAGAPARAALGRVSPGTRARGISYKRQVRDSAWTYECLESQRHAPGTNHGSNKTPSAHGD